MFAGIAKLVGADVIESVQDAGEWLHIAAESHLTSDIRFSDWTSLTEALDRIEFAHWCKCQPVYVHDTQVDTALCDLCQWEMWLDSVRYERLHPEHSCSDDRWCPEFGCSACDADNAKGGNKMKSFNDLKAEILATHNVSDAELDEMTYVELKAIVDQADTDADQARMYNGF